MRPIRVLVADDSAIIRRLLCQVIDDEPDLEVIGTAENGALAVERVAELRPDIVTLDVEMPEMDGLQAVTRIRARHPNLPVIMFSTLTVASGRATLDALARGASDFVTKPSGSGGLGAALARIREELVPKIRALAAKSIAAPSPRPKVALAQSAHRAPRRIDAVVVAVSTGGPTALERMIPQLPADLPVPVLVVQHMPTVFTGLLAERLDRLSMVRVVEAQAGAAIEPATVYVAPGGQHLTVTRTAGSVSVALTDEPPVHSCRPAADVLFRSAVSVWGGQLLAVVLTGMGEDGAAGAKAIRDLGGRVIVQDEATSVVWGMPGATVRLGAADAVVALDDVASGIARDAWYGRSAMIGAGRTQS